MAIVLGTNAGFVLARPVADPGGEVTSSIFDGATIGSKVVAPAGGAAITEVGIWCDTISEAAMMQVGLYNHDVANDCPHELLAGTADFAKGIDAGWKYAALAWPLVAGDTYWLAAQLDGVVTDTKTDRSVTALSGNYAIKYSAALPADWDGAVDYANTRLIALYAVYTLVKIPLFAASKRRRSG